MWRFNRMISSVLSPGSLFHRTAICIVALACTGGACRFSQADDSEEPVVSLLESKAIDLTSVRLVWSCQVESDADALPQALKADAGLLEDLRFHIPYQYSLAWQTGRKYLKSSSRSEELEGTDVTEISFDGRIIYFGTIPNEEIRNGITSLSKEFAEQEESRQKTVSFFYNDYLEAIGLRLPLFPEGETASSLVHSLLQDGGKVVSSNLEDIDSTDILKLQIKMESRRDTGGVSRYAAGTDRIYEFHLDLSRNAAVLYRSDHYDDGSIIRSYHNSSLSKLPGSSVWLPETVEIRYYYIDDDSKEMLASSPVVVQTLSLDEAGTDPLPDSQFKLHYTKPGTQVTDGTLPEAGLSRFGAVTYVVPAKPEDLDKAIELARLRVTNPGAMLPSSISIQKKLLLAVNFAVIAGLFLVFMFRKHRR